MSARTESGATESSGAAPVTDELEIAAQWKPLFLLLMAAALMLRVVMAFVVERHVQSAGRPFLIEGDANGYWELAEKIATGDRTMLFMDVRFYACQVSRCCWQHRLRSLETVFWPLDCCWPL